MNFFGHAPPFADRRDAGRQLAKRLRHLAGREDVVVLALPRGGVPVAFEVARALGAPLYAFLVRKLGAPGNPELALGALAADGTTVVDRGLMAEMEVSEAYLAEEIARQRSELARRAGRLAPWLALPPLAGRTVVLVDDGVATGATVQAALSALGAHRPARRVLAVPVGQQGVLERLGRLADEVVAVANPELVFGVGGWYADFQQVGDEEVARLLDEARHGAG
jgi:putative phosphoribosyl transferase